MWFRAPEQRARLIRKTEKVSCDRSLIGTGQGQNRRAISGPLNPVTSGLSRSLADTPPRWSGHVTGPDGTDSQADKSTVGLSTGTLPLNPETGEQLI